MRQLIGYDRYESAGALTLFEATCTDWRLYLNFFQPARKLVAKERVGSKVRKRYDRAQTPCQRVLARTEADEVGKERLRELYRTLSAGGSMRTWRDSGGCVGNTNYEASGVA